jgi:S1-C subfamily serine protease
MRGRLVSVALAGVLALALPGCGGSRGDRGGAPRAAGGPPADTVVAVEGVYATRRIRSTGVVFEAAQGLVLTADHAVEGATGINVRMSDGSVAHARAIARAQCHDLALLELFPKPTGLRALPLGDSRSADLGEPVTTLTYDSRPALRRVRGTIAAVGVRVGFPPLPPVGSLIAHVTRLAPSASGSPIVDASGQMIGLNVLAGQPSRPAVRGVEYALSANAVRAVLRRLRPGARASLSGWADERTPACTSALRQLVTRP